MGGQISATLIADHTRPHGLPMLAGFTESYLMCTIFLVVCVFAGLIVPRLNTSSAPAPSPGLDRPRAAPAEVG